MAIMCNNLSPQSLIQGLGWKPNSVITNNPCKNKDHPQSGESNWHPLQWLLFQQSLRWIWWQWGSHHIHADSWEGRVEYREACWWAQIQWPVSHCSNRNETPSLPPLHHVEQIWVFGTYPALFKCPDSLSSSAWISITWGCSWSSITNICTTSFTSIQVRPGYFFTLLSNLCHWMVDLRSHWPPAALLFDRTHSPQHSQGLFQELILQCALPSPHCNELCKQQARPSILKYQAHRASSWPDSLPHQDGQHSQKDQPTTHSAVLLQKSCELKS